MNTKLLMVASALVMAISGVVLQFFPQETLSYFGASDVGIASVLLQLTGALYLGFAVMNWMAKTILSSNKPV